MSTEEPKRRRPAGTTPEARERQLIRHAVDLAEKQLLDGTASAQVITHYLKLGSTRERLEQERLELENKMTKAKTEQIASQAKSDEMYKEAMDAFRLYSGQAPPPRKDEDYD